jgi:hypothetical protein
MKLDKLSIYERTFLLVREPKKYFNVVSKESLDTVFTRMFPVIIVILLIQLLVTIPMPFSVRRRTRCHQMNSIN